MHAACTHRGGSRGLAATRATAASSDSLSDPCSRSQHGQRPCSLRGQDAKDPGSGQRAQACKQLAAASQPPSQPATQPGKTAGARCQVPGGSAASLTATSSSHSSCIMALAHSRTSSGRSSGGSSATTSATRARIAAFCGQAGRAAQGGRAAQSRQWGWQQAVRKVAHGAAGADACRAMPAGGLVGDKQAWLAGCWAPPHAGHWLPVEISHHHHGRTWEAARRLSNMLMTGWKSSQKSPLLWSLQQKKGRRVGGGGVVCGACHGHTPIRNRVR